MERARCVWRTATCCTLRGAVNNATARRRRLLRNVSLKKREEERGTLLCLGLPFSVARWQHCLFLTQIRPGNGAFIIPNRFSSIVWFFKDFVVGE